MSDTTPKTPREESGLSRKFTDAECAAYVWLMHRGIRGWLVDLVKKQVHTVTHDTMAFASLVEYAQHHGWEGASMTTEDCFQAALDANPRDQVTRAQLADYLQELGDPRWEGYAVLAAFGKRPTYGGWRVDEVSPDIRRRCFRLPGLWFLGERYGRVDYHQSELICNASKTRRDCEDRAATLFASYTPEIKARIVAELRASDVRTKQGTVKA